MVFFFFFPVKIWFDLKTRRPLTAAVAVLLVGMETGGAAVRDGSWQVGFCLTIVVAPGLRLQSQYWGSSLMGRCFSATGGRFHFRWYGLPVLLLLGASHSYGAPSFVARLNRYSASRTTSAVLAFHPCGPAPQGTPVLCPGSKALLCISGDRCVLNLLETGTRKRRKKKGLFRQNL